MNTRCRSVLVRGLPLLLALVCPQVGRGADDGFNQPDQDISQWERSTEDLLWNFSNMYQPCVGMLIFLLATQYVALGILLRPEKLPGIGSQATIWGCYAVFILLLVLSLEQQAAQVDAVAPEGRTPLPWQRWLLFAVVFSRTSTAFQPLAVFLKIPMFVALCVGGIIVGWVLLIASVLRIFVVGDGVVTSRLQEQPGVSGLRVPASSDVP